MLTSTSHTLLQRVPAPLAAVRSLGSSEPGALLLDAAALFADGDARCDEAMRSLVREDGALAAGVAQTIAAALVEWDAGNQ